MLLQFIKLSQGLESLDQALFFNIFEEILGLDAYLNDIIEKKVYLCYCLLLAGVCCLVFILLQVCNM